MKNTVLLFTVLFFVSTGNLFSQNLFDIKFDNCNTDKFIFEKDTMSAIVGDSLLVAVLTSGFEESIRKEIRGTVSLQIIVNTEGKSCLLSAKNESNIGIEKLHLKKSVNDNLVWEKPKENISTLVLLRFEKKGLIIKHLGMVADEGLQELKE